MQGVANLELGLAQELGVGLAGEEFSEAAGLVEEGLLEGIVEALGFGFLFGGKVHAGTPSRGNSWMRSDAPTVYPISHPLSRRSPCLTRPSRKALTWRVS